MGNKNEGNKSVELEFYIEEENNVNNYLFKQSIACSEPLIPINNAFLEEYKNNFEIIKLLKNEFVYKIYQAKNIKDKKKVCLKVYDKKMLELGDYDYFLEQIKREEEIIKICKSKHIVNIYKKLETQNNIIFEMEFVNEDLSTYIRNRSFNLIDIEDFIEILNGITEALKVLNNKGIIHRDIRPRNIFLTGKNKIKLGGFGYSIYKQDNSFEQVGSYFYAAPEIIKNLEYDEKCDLWSLGITLHELYFGVKPYGKYATINTIKHAIYYEDNFNFSKSPFEQINQLFKKLLVINSKNRINYAEYFDYVKNLNKNKDELFLITRDKTLDSLKNIHKKKINIESLNEKKQINEYYLKGQFIDKIMNIINSEHFPDIMNIPNGLIYSNKNEKIKFNNIIYYDENSDFSNYVNKDSDKFEKNTSGAFILCNNIDSMKIIREEILQKRKNDKAIIFNLITSGKSCEKILEFLNENLEFENCINNICVFCFHIDRYKYLKQYPKINDNIYITRNDVIKKFINKYSSETIKPFPLTKLVTYEDYKTKYKDRHLKISEFYGNINIEICQKYFAELENLINEESIDKKLSIEKDRVIRGFTYFNLNKKNNNDSKMENFDLESMDQILINQYTKDTFYKDLNKWLMNSNNSNINYYETIAYFTSRLMYSLNSYALKNDKFFTKDGETLYRGVKLPYSNLLPYERAKGKIIVLTAFTSTSELKEKAIYFSGRKNPENLYKRKLLFSTIFYIKNSWKKNLVSNCINIQEIALCKSEKEILFQPFTFYRVEDVIINHELYTADIYLEAIAKTKILEGEIKKGNNIIYDEKENLIDIEKK